jgi:ATP-binding cassette subfamily B protein
MERGATLSVGQRQLISFVRAMVYNPEILILDEATSSVDSETEELIQESIEKMMQGRTSIVIAHRLSTIQKADQILVLNKGEIVERGTHQELLATENGYYANLHKMQYKMMI